MRFSRIVLRGSVAGVAAGVLLGLFLKIVENVFGIKVYTLLLNVDYIPILKEFPLPEIVEFSLHLIISVVVATVLYYVVARGEWSRGQMVFYVILLCSLLGVFLYPTTALSERTPPIDSVSAIFFWLIGHTLYGGVLSLFYWKNKSKTYC